MTSITTIHASGRYYPEWYAKDNIPAAIGSFEILTSAKGTYSLRVDGSKQFKEFSMGSREEEQTLCNGGNDYDRRQFWVSGPQSATLQYRDFCTDDLPQGVRLTFGSPDEGKDVYVINVNKNYEVESVKRVEPVHVRSVSIRDQLLIVEVFCRDTDLSTEADLDATWADAVGKLLGSDIEFLIMGFKSELHQHQHIFESGLIEASTNAVAACALHLFKQFSIASNFHGKACAKAICGLGTAIPDDALPVLDDISASRKEKDESRIAEVLASMVASTDGVGGRMIVQRALQQKAVVQEGGCEACRCQ